MKNTAPHAVYLLISVLVAGVGCCSCLAPAPTSSVDHSMGDTWTRPADGMAMVYVPAGEFPMGSDDAGIGYALQLCVQYLGPSDCKREQFTDEQPVHTVALDGFWIDRTEVTNAQYRRCAQAGACDPPAEDSSRTYDQYFGNHAYADYPVIHVNHSQATDYCKWAGARLPSEAEWEYAARGPEGQRYPWGDDFDGTRTNYCDVNCALDWADRAADDGYDDAAPVASYPEGVSWCGALDMAGNVWEWVADWYGEGYYGPSPSHSPAGPQLFVSGYRVLRGGSWRDAPHSLRTAGRSSINPFRTEDNIGFRCASSLSERDNFSAGQIGGKLGPCLSSSSELLAGSDSDGSQVQDDC